MRRIRVASKKQEPRYLSGYFDLKASNKGPPCSLNMYLSHSRNLESEVKFSKTPTHVLLQLGHPKQYIDSVKFSRSVELQASGSILCKEVL